MFTVGNQIKNIVGLDFVEKDPEIASSLFANEIDENIDFRIVSPQTAEEVQKVVKLANEENIPVYSSYESWFSHSDITGKNGIIFDFKRMNKIEKIDPKNLVVHIQRGVTFDQLIKELNRYDIELSLPVSATSPYVTEQYVNRNTTMKAARYPEVAVSNMKVVLPNGDIHLTGSHALSEETADHKEDGGPNLSQWYIGGRDIFGIVIRSTIWLFPKWNIRKMLFFGFDSKEEAAQFVREIPRRELCTGAIAMNKKMVSEKFEKDAGSLPEWTAMLIVEGVDELVAYREKKILSIADEKGISNISDDLKDKENLVEMPWYADDRMQVGFYSRFDTISLFDEIVENGGVSLNDTGQMIVSSHWGGCSWLEYDFKDSNLPAPGITDITLKLNDKGALFNSPTGTLAEDMYANMDSSYITHINRIKKMIDPKNILNPGLPMKNLV